MFRHVRTEIPEISISIVPQKSYLVEFSLHMAQCPVIPQTQLGQAYQWNFVLHGRGQVTCQNNPWLVSPVEDDQPSLSSVA